MLELDGRCAVYAHRPLVCRTQGYALRYPAGFMPEAAEILIREFRSKAIGRISLEAP